MLIKNKWIGLSFLAIMLLSACTKEQLPKEQTFKPIEEIPTSIESGGDGAYDVLGWGYDATIEFANSDNSSRFQVIDLAAFMASNPTRVVEAFPNSQTYKEEYAENAQSYALKISNNISATATFPLFGQTISAGFTSALTTSGKFDGKYVYSSNNLTIRQRHININSDAATLQSFLTADFLNDVNTYYTNPQILVQKYGTHVLTDIFTGAKLTLMFQSETYNTNREEAARVGITVGVKDVFNIDISNGVDITRSSQNYNRKLYYATRGGNPAIGLTGTISLDQSNPPISFSAWQNSSTRDNAVLVDIGANGMILLYDLIADPVKKAAVKTYVDQYLLNNQVYLDHLAVPIYEFYNPAGRDHHYSTSNAPIVGYTAYGEKFKAYSYQVPNTVPYYRYYSAADKDHYLSTSSTPPTNFVPEGIAFYAFPNQSTGTVPIYEYYSGSDKDHYYTKSSTTPGGFSPFGVKFYAY